MRWWLEDIGWIALGTLLVSGIVVVFVKNKWEIFTRLSTAHFLIMSIWYTVWLLFNPIR